MELNFNSVETIPNLNASAAFSVDSGKVFKEDVDIVNTMCNNDVDFEEFNHSRTKKLFEPPIFENKKDKHGYWF